MNRDALLSDYIDAVTRRPFAYGETDCLLVVAGWVEILTGIDHAAGFRGRYRSLAEGRRLIGATPLRFVRDRLPEKTVARADVGDIAGLKQGREWVFGIFAGPQIYVQTRGGMGILPRRLAKRAFDVTTREE